MEAAAAGTNLGVGRLLLGESLADGEEVGHRECSGPEKGSGSVTPATGKPCRFNASCVGLVEMAGPRRALGSMGDFSNFCWW
jgi:hypothetical protein